MTEKCRNCGKDMYFYTNILHDLGVEKKLDSISGVMPNKYDCYHVHNNSTRCSDETFTHVERQGNCVHCDLEVIEDWDGMKHLHPIRARLFKKCKKAELPSPITIRKPDLTKAWRGFKRSLGY